MKRSDQPLRDLSRRERQIMDIIYERGQACAAEVVAALPDAPSYTAVRTLLTILERKGHIKHNEVGTRYIYAPTRPRRAVGQAALKRALQTFYDGSVEKAVAAMLDMSETQLSEDEIDRLAKLIEQARQSDR
jgi:predicted transcriptional regulator